MDFSTFQPQSGLEMQNFSVTEPSKDLKSQIVTFSDQNPAYNYTVDSNADSTYGVADMDDVGLENFFSRPIKIAAYSWGTGTVLFQRFNPWSLFFENTRVLNRLSNYSLMRCKLHLKIIINGNGFHYGRAICSYNPRFNVDQFTVDRAFFHTGSSGCFAEATFLFRSYDISRWRDDTSLFLAV
jgi:hypothetical protein